VRDSVEGQIQFNTIASTGQAVETSGSSSAAAGSSKPRSDTRGSTHPDSDAGPGSSVSGRSASIVHREPMRDTLFDEKIDGSLHLTPGTPTKSPKMEPLGVQWDMVLIQRRSMAAANSV